MRALVTGGTGFIGAWIIKHFRQTGMQIRVLDINQDLTVARAILGDDADNIDWRTGDIAQADAVLSASEGCDVIIHLAAILTPDCQADPIRGAHINLLGSLHVFEAAREHGIARVLYMSSAGVFGPEHARTPEPTTLYGAYKLAMEGAARAYWNDHQIASVGFRPLIVYGPCRESGLTAAPSQACKAAARGEDAHIPFTGDMDFVYVEDVAASYLEAFRAASDGARIYNIVGDECTVEDFGRTIENQVQGATVTVSGPTLPFAPGMEGTPLRQDFPQIPRTTVPEGIAKTITFYR